MLGISLTGFFSLLFSSFLAGGAGCGGGGEITCLGGGNTVDGGLFAEGTLMEARTLN